MLIGVKQCVERNDLRGLHYIFAEALEADPTFEKYQEDYEYCKKLPVFLKNFSSDPASAAPNRSHPTAASQENAM